MVMTHKRKVEVKDPLGSKDTVDSNGRTDGRKLIRTYGQTDIRTEPIALPYLPR